jgi:Tol biopolymer transport system component
MPLSPGIRLGPYEVLARLGAGGMGEVYRAKDTALGREVALKVLSPALVGDSQYMARFEREAQVLASLNHPHIATLHGLEESGGVRALVMELVEGPTLADRIALGPVPLEDALAVARQIAEALEFAHERGIIHRDLKPANVKLTRDGAVKVLDFGLAKALDDEAAASAVANSPTITMAATRAGVILGTAAYMPPEQAKGKPVDRRADIWAFGVVLFEMLSGRQMYKGETTPETLASVMRDEPRWETLPADTPPAIQKLLRRCLDKNPKRRLRDIGEARIALEDSGSGTAVAPVIPEAKPKAVSNRLPWALAAVATLAALALAFFHFREAPPVERVLRYSIPAPEKTSIHTFALSPDGHYLAMAVTQEGKRELWVRALDTLQPQRLPGTDEATYPFWSPDSRYIGFFTQGKLKKIAVSGGPAQSLCDAPDGRGGTWNRDGVILFAPTPNAALQRVTAIGGVPAPVTKVEGGAFHRFPVFLPDGRRFLYQTSGAGEKSGVYLASLDSQTGQRLLAEPSRAIYSLAQAGSKIGYLLFIRENTLMSQPVESDTVRPAGDLFPVAEQVSYGAVFGYAPASVSENGILAYHAGRGISESQLVWYDRAGKELGKVGARSNANGFALSPDEKTVAAPRSQTAARSIWDIWLHEIGRGAETRFTFHQSINMQPVWSPDGRRLMFTSNRAGPYDLYLKDTSGAGQDEAFFQKPGTPKYVTDWSRDGRFLLYVDTDPRTKWDLWTVPVSGDRKAVPFLQTEFNEAQGQFSPDVNWIAYASDESGRYEIYVRPFPPGPAKWKISISGGQHPRWRSDGKELFYLSPELKLMSVAIKAVPGRSPVFEAAAPQVLFESHAVAVPAGFNMFNYAVAADGKRFLVSTSGREAADAPVTVVTNWQAAVKK